MDVDVWVKGTGLFFLAIGLWFTVASLRIVHVEKNLDTQWSRGSARVRAAMRTAKRKVFGKPPSQLIEVHSSDIGHIVANVEVSVTDVATEGREPTTDERVEALERDLRQVRDAISSQANDLSGRIDRLRVDMDSGVQSLSTRMDAAENDASKVDARAVNYETWGLLFTILGTVCQGVAEFV